MKIKKKGETHEGSITAQRTTVLILRKETCPPGCFSGGRRGGEEKRGRKAPLPRSGKKKKKKLG